MPLITGWRASVYLSRIRSASNCVVLLRSREPGGRVVCSMPKSSM